MARPLRIEFAGALYHITSRDDRCEAIYEDDEDREVFLGVLAEVVERYNWICHAFCLMTNHYHLVIETVEGNLSQGMRQLNGVYTQASNRRHKRVGHLFQGRFKGILVDKDAYLLELSRYVVLNPLRAGMVNTPAQWRWSSYRAMMGQAPVPKQGIWEGLRQQIYLGDEAFVERMQAKAKIDGDALTVPQAQRRPPVSSLADIAARHRGQNAAIVAAYATGAYSYREIAEYFSVHLATVGRIVRAAMQRCEN